MNEEHVDIHTDDGVMPTFTCWPDTDGPFPAIIFYMDAPAIREELLFPHDLQHAVQAQFAQALRRLLS